MASHGVSYARIPPPPPPTDRYNRGHLGDAMSCMRRALQTDRYYFRLRRLRFLPPSLLQHAATDETGGPCAPAPARPSLQTRRQARLFRLQHMRDNCSTVQLSLPELPVQRPHTMLESASGDAPPLPPAPPSVPAPPTVPRKNQL